MVTNSTPLPHAMTFWLTLLFSAALAIQAQALEVTPVQLPPETRIQPFAKGMPRSFKPEWKGNVREIPGANADNSVTVILPRGEGKEPGAGGTFRVDKPVWVYLAVFDRGQPTLAGWEPTRLHLTWVNAGNDLLVDRIVKRRFPAGQIEIPPHDGTDGRSFGVPHLTLIREEPIAEPSDAKTAEQLRAEWVKGETLGNSLMEITVASHPSLRLTGLKRPGEADWLRPYSAQGGWGLRTWVMFPEGQIAASMSISQQPARLERVGKLKIIATGEDDPKTALALRWEVEMDAQRPVVRIKHIIRNNSTHSQTVAPWAIALVNHNNTGKTLSAADDARPDSLPLNYLMSGDKTDTQRLQKRTIVALGQIGLRLDATPPSEIKLGSVSRTGWTLFEREDTAQLISWSPFPEGTIPDGGRNLTLYHNGPLAEIEHVGALATLAPGEETSLLQELTIKDAASNTRP